MGSLILSKDVTHLRFNPPTSHVAVHTFNPIGRGRWLWSTQ